VLSHGLYCSVQHFAALEEKLLWLRDHPNDASAMEDAAQRHVIEKFTWPAVVRSCLEI
jgi:hypothetical protein